MRMAISGLCLRMKVKADWSIITAATSSTAWAVAERGVSSSSMHISPKKSPLPKVASTVSSPPMCLRISTVPFSITYIARPEIALVENHGVLREVGAHGLQGVVGGLSRRDLEFRHASSR